MGLAAVCLSAMMILTFNALAQNPTGCGDFFAHEVNLTSSHLIDPNRVTNFERSDSELELFLLFGIFVAGKGSEITAKKLARFLDGGSGPFAMIRTYIEKGVLIQKLQESGTGKYSLYAEGLPALVGSKINLRTVSKDELMMFPGIGPKTARFFILHSRAQSEVAVLDVHILRWLRKLGYPTPEQTPQGQRYLEIEKWFLNEAHQRNVSPADLDIAVWIWSRQSEDESSLPLERILEHVILKRMNAPYTPL